jgi:hypothetical protein
MEAEEVKLAVYASISYLWCESYFGPSNRYSRHNVQIIENQISTSTLTSKADNRAHSKACMKSAKFEEL